MPDEREEHEEEDKSIVDALSTLGWVEEEEEGEETLEAEENIKEQLNFFKEENKKLIGEINEKNELIHNLEKEVRELSKTAEDNTVQNQAIQKLYETIESKNDEIESLKALNDEQAEKSEKIINDQVQKIKELTAQLEKFQLDQTENQDLIGKLHEKDKQIKELEEQLQYLEDDTIQKSKFKKLELLLEKKDEVITEKEKVIFNMENSLKTANQKIHELQQQMETFNLVKKDLEKKAERNKALVVEIEELKQKNLTNLELINHLEEKLEEAHVKSGNLTGKFELELANLRSLLDGKDEEIKTLKEESIKFKKELSEYQQVDEKLLSDIQNIKDEKLKKESELDEKNKEIIELKKKIKLMRRDMQKS